MINQALRNLVLPVPEEAIMHDWWLAMVASTFGWVDAVASPTVLYRQHGRNDTGAMHWNLLDKVQVLFVRKRRQAAIAQLDAVLARLEGQATAFVDRYEKRLAPAERRMLHAFSSLRSRNFIMRRYLMLRYGFIYSNAMRNMGLLLLR